MTEQMAERVARRYPCCACCEGIALDDHVGHGGSIEKDGHDGPCESCERAAIAASLVAAAQAEVLREVADDIARCADAGWSAGQIATALNNRASQAEPRTRPANTSEENDR